MRRKSAMYTLLLLMGLAAQSLFAGSNLTGTVNYEGPIPKPRPIKMGADPVCSMDHATTPTSQAVVINDNSTMRWVMVSIESGIDGRISRCLPNQPS